MSFLFSFRSRATVAQFAVVMGVALALVLGYAWAYFNVLMVSEAAWEWHRVHSLELLGVFYMAMICLSWPLWAASVNRLHDADRSGGPAIWILVPWLMFWGYPLLQLAAGEKLLQMSSILMFGGWLTFAAKGGTQAGSGPNAWGTGRREWTDTTTLEPAILPELRTTAAPASPVPSQAVATPVASARPARQLRRSPKAQPAFGRRS